MRTELSSIGVDVGILFPDNMLLMAPIPMVEYATALGHAYNRWLAEEWIGKADGLYGALLACPQNPIDSAASIREYGKNPGIVAIYLPTAGVNPLWGNRKYDPIFEAAQEMDLPVVLHSVTIVSPAFPCNTDQFENAWARQMLGHSFGMMANFVSIMHTGLPARFPESEDCLYRGGDRLGPVHDLANGQVPSRISSSGPVPGASTERIHQRADVVRNPTDRRARESTVHG